jgi:signal-transduction protein with cAMP-binding, CBS, and nucleotidyltransferase domain
LDLEKTIGEYMKRNPLIVSPEATLKEVASKMAEREMDVVVVQDGEGIVRGLVTASDLFGAMRSYVLGKDLLEQIPKDIRDIQVQEIMGATKAEEFMEACGLTGTQLCITLGEWDTIANAIRVMALGGLDHILIVGEGGVAGTLSDNDLVKAFTE